MEGEKLLKINDFFKSTVDTASFSKAMRRMAHVLVQESLKNENLDKKWVSEGYFWLTEFVEIIDPYIDTKD